MLNCEQGSCLKLSQFVLNVDDFHSLGSNFRGCILLARTISRKQLEQVCRDSVTDRIRSDEWVVCHASNRFLT
eukprot:COSAG03_NODE_4774_length_1439_cov_1.305224_3_plen_72_part_01